MALLAAEKAIQHAAVTAGFILNISNLRASVALDYRVLMVAGAILALLFAAAFWMLFRNAAVAVRMLSLLALADIVGEFVAQGTLGIALNVSFIVAVILLVSTYHAGPLVFDAVR
jgi:hypothetical protein